MASKKDLMIVAHLRQNARVSLTHISKETHIPVSTLFDKLKQFEGKMIHRHIALLNFSQLGFMTRAIVLIKTAKKNREALCKMLTKHYNVNSLYKVNNGFDFQFECVFKNIRQLEEFIEMLEDQFVIKSKEIHYIIDEFKREAFLSDPELIPPGLVG